MKRLIPVIIGIAVLVAALAVGGTLYRVLTAPAPDEIHTDNNAAIDKSSAEIDVVDDGGEITQPESGLAEAADFTVLDADGNEVRLSDRFGRPLVVNFWATWCPPCRSELPDFQALYEEYGDRVEFLMVNLTTAEDSGRKDVDRFIAENGYTFPLYYDETDSAAMAYGISSIPQTVFITSEGRIYSSYLGAMDAQTIEQQLQLIAPE